MNFFRKPQLSGGSGYSKMDGGVKAAPQVTLNVTCDPPILDTQHQKQQTRNRSLWPRQMWNHFANMFSTAPPVFWVNPQVVREQPPPPQYESISPAQYTMLASPTGLWCPAPPGGMQQQMMMDPLCMLQQQDFYSGKTQQLPYQTCLPTKLSSTRPLNPDAKEWIPREYRSATSSTSAAPSPQNMTHVAPESSFIPIIPYGAKDFCEITEKEIMAVREDELSCPEAFPGTLVDDKEWQSSLQPDERMSTGKNSHSITNNIPNRVSSEDISHCDYHERNDRINHEQDVHSMNFDNPANSESLSSGKIDHSERSVSPAEHESISHGTSQTLSLESNNRVNQNNSHSVCPESNNNVRQCFSHPFSETDNRLNQNITHPASHESYNGMSQACTNHSGSSACFDNVTQEPVIPWSDTLHNGSSISLSYAGVVGRNSPSPTPPKTDEKSPERQKGVDQPLPRIFQKDKAYPREAAVTTLENNNHGPELFKKLGKNQKNCSKRFLQELKEANENLLLNKPLPPPSHSPDLILSYSPSQDSTSLTTSVTSPSHFIPTLHSTPPSHPNSPTHTVQIPSHTAPPLHSTPPSHYNSPSLSTPSSCSSSLSTPPSDSHPLPIPTLSPKSGWVHVEIGSPGGRTRTSSESSRDSVDIEFGEMGEDEVDLRGPVAVSPVSRCPSKGSPKFTGKNLACILGAGDTDSEDEGDDDEDDDEWDTAWDDSCWDGITLDDSWETFGLGLVVTECKVGKKVPEKCSETQCEAEEVNTFPSLDEVNKKWEREVERNIKGRSGCRVRFGDQKVHPMVVWSYAYRAARHGPWEQLCRDRARFANRVASLEPVLSKVLDPDHRQNVYNGMHIPSTH